MGTVSIQCALAQTEAEKVATTPSSSQPNTSSEGVQPKSSLPVKIENHPSWNDLDANQKIALAPLQKLWSKMSDFQKQKWLVISKNYMNMGTDEQQRLQSRMNDWVSLSNQERAVARLNFAEVNKLSEEQKKSKWEAYQALEPDAKQKLLDATQPLPKGAAIAVHPTNKALLTNTPLPTGTQSSQSKRLPRIDVSQVSTQTLLPLTRTTSSDKPASQRAN
jgi:hypothetical protein